jgi:ABC-type multidrug transport system ATPase subunit
MVGIVGENGSGKSTLLNILAGVLDYDAGEIGQIGQIGWCPQDTRLYDRLTVDETSSCSAEPTERPAMR